MTDNEASLIEAALNWRRNHGACHPHEPGDLREIGTWTEAVIRDRNRAAQTNESPRTNSLPPGHFLLFKGEPAFGKPE